MNHILLTLLTLITLIFSTGCSITPKYHVTIDAITAPNVSLSPNSYTIKSLNNKKDSKGLLFQQYSQNLAEVLEKKGYRENHNQTANQIIYFDYGIEKLNEETEIYTQPNISFSMGWGFPYGGFYGHHYHPFYGDFYGGGYTTYRQTHTYYNRYITLLAKDQLNKELWRVDISSIGESKNLKKIIPILIKASEPYLGQNTPEPIELIIKEKKK